VAAWVLYADCSEWVDDTDVGHNSTFYSLPTVYFSQNSNWNNYSDNKG